MYGAKVESKVCGKCNTQAVANMALGELFYYCRGCKEEVGGRANAPKPQEPTSVFSYHKRMVGQFQNPPTQLTKEDYLRQNGWSTTGGLWKHASMMDTNMNVPVRFSFFGNAYRCQQLLDTGLSEEAAFKQWLKENLQGSSKYSAHNPSDPHGAITQKHAPKYQPGDLVECTHPGDPGLHGQKLEVIDFRTPAVPGSCGFCGEYPNSNEKHYLVLRDVSGSKCYKKFAKV